MTSAQLQAIYQAGLGVGHTEGLESVFTQGYMAGKGYTVTAATTSVVPQAANPSVIVTPKKPDLR